MVSYSPEQQLLLAKVEEVEADLRSGRLDWTSQGAMRLHDLVWEVCKRIKVNGHEMSSKVYEVIRMRDRGEIPRSGE